MSSTATMMPAVRPYSSTTTRSCSETAQLGDEEGVQRLGLRRDQCVAYDSCGPRSRPVREDQLQQLVGVGHPAHSVRIRSPASSPDGPAAHAVRIRPRASAASSGASCPRSSDCVISSFRSSGVPPARRRKDRPAAAAGPHFDAPLSTPPTAGTPSQTNAAAAQPYGPSSRPARSRTASVPVLRA
jgi:hypothetical protein